MAYSNISIDEVIARLIDYYPVDDAAGALAAVLDIKPWQAKMYVLGLLDRVDELSTVWVISWSGPGLGGHNWLTIEAKWEHVQNLFLQELANQGPNPEPKRVRLLAIYVPNRILELGSDRVDQWFDHPGILDLIEDEIPAIYDVTLGMTELFSTAT